MEKVKGARHADPVTGRLNLSEIGEKAFREALNAANPDVIMKHLSRRRKELREELETVEQQAKKTSGTTLDDWENDGKAHEETVLIDVKEKMRQRLDQKRESAQALETQWELHMKSLSGRSRTIQADMEWAKGHGDLLRLVGLTPEDFIARKRRRQPEVA